MSECVRETGSSFGQAPGRSPSRTLDRWQYAPADPPRDPRAIEHIHDVNLDAAVQCQEQERKLRILIVDDHRVVRKGLADLLEIEADIEVVGEASDGRMAIKLTRELRPDVVSMDISMPLMNGIEATREITSEFPSIRVVGLSMYEQGDMAMAMRNAGASAYVAKDSPPEVLLTAFRGS